MNTSTRQDYDSFLAKVSELSGLKTMTPDESGLLSLRVEDDYTLNLQYVAAGSKIFCFAELCDLPDDAPASVYRDLLVGTLFGQDTAGGYFSVEPIHNTVIYNTVFDFDAAEADPEAFAESLEKLLSLIDLWQQRIRKLLNDTAAPSAGSPISDFMSFRP